MREWSTMGEKERSQCFMPILDEVSGYFEMTLGRKPFDRESGERISVLHPGCGLGRLVFEFARRGYKSQGNEFAYFCLLSSNFILNATEHKDQFEIFPYLHSFSNIIKENDPFTPVKIPDVCPNEVMVGDVTNYDFSMVAGEFIEVYQNQARK